MYENQLQMPSVPHAEIQRTRQRESFPIGYGMCYQVVFSFLGYWYTHFLPLVQPV